MSTKLTKALEFANYAATINNQRAALRAKTEAMLSYSINGGTFTIEQSLISFVQECIRTKLSRVILLDIYKNPIMIEDLQSFQEEICSRYFEVVNDYYAEYEKLKRARKVHKVLDLNEDGDAE